MAPRSQVTKYWNGPTATGHKVRALCLDASRCAARRRADLGPFLRSAHWRSLYLTPVVRPVRRCFPGNFEPMTTLFIGATLAALTAISALTTATTRSSSNPCSSRGVWAVHVSCRLRCSCAAQHAAARADPSLRVRRSPRGSSRGGASRGGVSRGGVSRGGASRGGTCSASGGVSSSNSERSSAVQSQEERARAERA